MEVKKNIVGMENPLDLIAKYRVIQWGNIPEKIEFEFDLICYFKARMLEYGKGGYMFITARAVKDYPDHNIDKDELLIIQFAYRAYFNSVLSLSVKLKELCTRANMNEYGDIYMKFSKLDKKHMQIHNIERREGKESNLEIVEDMYKVL